MALRINTDTGLIEGARQVPSPNADDRGCEPDLIVIHAISLPPGEYGGPWIDHLFTNALDPDAHPYFADIAGRTLSAHVLVDRNGQITQYVPFHRRAWHAGESSYAGRVACNDFSIGIELEGCDQEPFTDSQYEVLGQLIRCLCASYPGLHPARLAGHADIAPGRKTDPGPHFDWARLRGQLR